MGEIRADRRRDDRDILLRGAGTSQRRGGFPKVRANGQLRNEGAGTPDSPTSHANQCRSGSAVARPRAEIPERGVAR